MSKSCVPAALALAAAAIAGSASGAASGTHSTSRMASASPSSSAILATNGREQSAPPSSRSASTKEGAVAACPAPGAPVAEPYRWYPSLDLARVPFHTAAGPWGPRAVIKAPEPPATHRTVHVTSASQLAAEARIPGTNIVVNAEYIGPAVVFGDVTDVDIVVPRGRTVGPLVIGRAVPPSATRRVRIRGSTPGVHSGGVIGAISFVSSPLADIIIDGVDLNGADGSGGGMLWNLNRGAERVAIVNVRGHAVGNASGMNGVDIVIAGNRIMSGARPREVTGSVGGWGIRGGGRLVVFDNRIDGTRYHRVRVDAEAGPPQYLWVANNTFVDPHEARILTAFNFGTPHRYAAMWAVCNRVYAHSTCMSPSFEGRDVAYAMLTNNSFWGSITEASQRSTQAYHGTDRDYLTGNRFQAWRAPPQWEAPGDPTTTVPLPPVEPGRYNAALKVPPCPPP